MLKHEILAAQNLFAAPNKAAILAFMETHPVHPPSGTLVDGRWTGKAPQAPGQAAPRPIHGQTHVQFSKQKLDNLVDRVAFIRCIDEQTAGEKGALSFDIKYADVLTTTASRVGYAPIWWLPWNTQGSLVKLRIEQSTMANINFGPGIDQVANPNLFFTAAINGCSIFAYGNVDGPSVYHAGLGGDVMQEYAIQNEPLLGATSEQVWGSLLNKVTFSGSRVFAPAPALATKQATKPNFSEVNKADYVAERTASGYVMAADGMGGKTKTTKRARDFQIWLEKQPVGRNLRAYSLSPWGCVFGVRTGNAWEMYLQRNATVMHATAKKSKGFVPLSWSGLVAAGPLQTCVVTLGLQRVFPTTEPVHYREFQNITFF